MPPWSRFVLQFSQLASSREARSITMRTRIRTKTFPQCSDRLQPRAIVHVTDGKTNKIKCYTIWINMQGMCRLCVSSFAVLCIQIAPEPTQSIKSSMRTSTSSRKCTVHTRGIQGNSSRIVVGAEPSLSRPLRPEISRMNI